MSKKVYSTWAFTYTPAYHVIENKTNQLTAQISCLDDGDDGNSNNSNHTTITAANLTKSYSVNVIGTIQPSERATLLSSAAAQEEQNNGTAATTTTTTSSEFIPSVPTIPSVPSSPSIDEQEEEEDNDIEEDEEPQPEPEPEPEDDEDTTIIWDIEDLEEDIDGDNEEVLDLEDSIFDLE